MDHLLNNPLLPRSIWEKIQPDPQTACWNWTGATINGYAVLWRRKAVYVRRHAYSTLVAELPDDANLLGTCGNKLCCSPGHVELRGQSRRWLRKQPLAFSKPPTPKPPLFADRRLPASFWNRVKVDATSGCWNWTDLTRAGDGYWLSETGEPIYVGLVVHTRLVGPVPARGLVSSSCGSSLCCNPEHLGVAVIPREEIPEYARRLPRWRFR